MQGFITPNRVRHYEAFLKLSSTSLASPTSSRRRTKSSVGHTVLSITQPRPLEAVNLRKVNKVRGHWSARNSA
ncbi:hypothetical protein YC2023_054413 [Brassica napus]